ncbi:hypothetical protein BGZ60DRAFT_555756 [Tricladium varicosporioides]|nr:hypothetical protein BGZ60DRAFT_555756 [Hymenoscyphus varicosporioides]
MYSKKPRDPRDDPNRKRHINNSRVAGKESYESKPSSEPEPPSRIFFDLRTGVATRGGVPLRATGAQDQQGRRQQGGGLGERARRGHHISRVSRSSGSEALPKQHDSISQPSYSHRVGTKRPWEANGDEEDVPYHAMCSAVEIETHSEQIRLSRQAAAQSSLVGDVNAPFQPVRSLPPPITMGSTPTRQQRFNSFVANEDMTSYHPPRLATKMTAAPFTSRELSVSVEGTYGQDGGEAAAVIGEKALEDSTIAGEAKIDVNDSFYNTKHFFEGVTTAADVRRNLETFFNTPLKRIFVGSKQAIEDVNNMTEQSADRIKEYEIANEALRHENTNLASQLRISIQNNRRLEEERQRQRNRIENLEKTISNQVKGRH